MVKTDKLIKMSPALHTSVKIMAAREGRSVKALVAEAVTDYIAKKSKLPETKK
ncbi:ribbon-helix-helix domain-containing protein [Chloroflexota bacterium]